MIRKRIKYLIISILSAWFITSCNKDSFSDSENENPTITYDLFNMNKVPEIKLKFSVAEWNKLLGYYDQNPLNDKKVIAKFTFSQDGQSSSLDSIGVKLRGNTSRRRPEGTTGELHNSVNPDWHHCHFGLDFDKFKDEQKFQGLEKLVLKWFKDDADYVREIYSFDLFEQFGIWTAPRASYCRVTIEVEGDNAPAYYGVYAMIESIDEDYLAYRNVNWSENGFLWKAGWSGSYNADFVQTISIGVEDVKLNPADSKYYTYDLKTRENELETGKTELINFIQNLNNKTGDDFKNWISQSMDIDLFLKTYAVNVIVGMWDDYWINGNNFYFYFSPDGKAFFIPYDYDNTLGTSGIISNSGTQNPLAWGNSSGKPLLNKILAIPEYQEKYKQYIRDLINTENNLFATSASISRISRWQSMINPYVSNDTEEDMIISDNPASWGNCSFYRLLSGNNLGGANGEANFFSSRISSIPF